MAFGFGMFKENTEYFGLDIGTSSIKVVQLKKTIGGKFELVSFGSSPVPEGISQSDSDMDKKKLAEVINKLVHSMHLYIKNVVTSLSGDSIFTTVVKLPKMPMAEIKKAVEYQAEQNIPLKISEVKIDWQLIGTAPSGELFVMIIAAPMNKTKKVMDIVEQSGLDLNAVEIDSIALARSLRGSEPLFMIVNIGTMLTEVSVVNNGLVSLSRTIPVGGQTITRSISQSLGMEMSQAEQFKVKLGVEEDKMEGKIYKAAKPILDSLTEEIERSIKYYYNQFGGNIPLLKLTGGASKTLGMQKFLSGNLDINVAYGNPWEMVSYKEEVKNQLKSNAADFAVAVGLAMRGL